MKEQFKIKNKIINIYFNNSNLKELPVVILNNYSEYCEDKDLARKELELSGIDVKRRAESVTLEEFIRLYEVHIHESKGSCKD